MQIPLNLQLRVKRSVTIGDVLSKSKQVADLMDEYTIDTLSKIWGCSKGLIQKYKSIGECKRMYGKIFSKDVAIYLPTSYSTLAELTKLGDIDFHNGIVKEYIHKNMRRKDALEYINICSNNFLETFV